MTESDHEIIRRVQHGDRKAYSELFDRHYATVYRFARSLTRDADLASDIASETFCRAYKAADGFRADDETSYLAYLLQIAKRLMMRETTRHWREPARSIDDPEVRTMRLIDSCRQPVDAVLADERRRAIAQALDCLAAEDREIVLLAFERELSRRDIAAVMGKPSITSVTSHLHRAMKKLRSIVGQHGYFDAYPVYEEQRP